MTPLLLCRRAFFKVSIGTVDAMGDRFTVLGLLWPISVKN